MRADDGAVRLFIGEQLILETCHIPARCGAILGYAGDYKVLIFQFDTYIAPDIKNETQGCQIENDCVGQLKPFRDKLKF